MRAIQTMRASAHAGAPLSALGLADIDTGAGAVFALLLCRVAPTCILLSSLAKGRPAVAGPLALAALLAATLLPLAWMPAQQAPTLSPALSASVIAQALGLGLVIALALASPLVALSWLGGALTRSLGLFDGHDGLARCYGALGLALFFAFGGHRMAIEVLAASLHLAPLAGASGPATAVPAGFIALAELAAFAGSALTQALAWALLWAAPFFVSLWLFDGLLALSGRFAGALVLAPMVAPVRVAFGLCLLVAGGAFVVEVFPRALQHAVMALQGLLGST